MGKLHRKSLVNTQGKHSISRCGKKIWNGLCLWGWGGLNYYATCDVKIVYINAPQLFKWNGIFSFHCSDERKVFRFIYIFNISHSSEKRQSKPHNNTDVFFFLQFKIYNIIIYYYNSYNMTWKYLKKKASFIFIKTISMALKIMILDRKIRGLKGPQVIPTIADTSQFQCTILHMFTVGCKHVNVPQNYYHISTCSPCFSMRAHKWRKIQFCC